MRYDLGSYLERKRISLEEFAANNNIKSVNDIGMFILNNKTFELSDELVERLAAMCQKEPESVDDMLLISPNISSLGEEHMALSILAVEDERIMAKLLDGEKNNILFAKDPAPVRKRKKSASVNHSSSAANRS